MIKQKILIDYEDKIQELEFELNTLETGVSSFITKEINGELDCIIIEPEKSVQVSISFEKYSSIKIYDSGNEYVSMQTYLPIRLNSIAPNGERLNFSQEKFCLNDKLRIEIGGPLNTKVKFVIRYS
jgi:hypothetical protein